MAQVRSTENSFELLRKGADAKLGALDNKARQAFFLKGFIDGTKNKIDVLRSRLSNAKKEDDIWEIMPAISRLERGMEAKEHPKISQINGVLKPSGRKTPFFDYMLEEEMPANFVEKAIAFRDDIGNFGWKMDIDAGLVFASGPGGRSAVAGHMVRTFTTHAAVHSEYPKWKRRGTESAETVSCSIKFQDSQVGINQAETKGFAFAAMKGADDWSRALFGQMEGRFRLRGLAFELNEDGRRLHMYFASPGKLLVATLFESTLVVPPEAWQAA